MNMGCISRGNGFVDQQIMFFFVMEKIAIWRRHRSLLRNRLTNPTIPLITKTWFSPVPQLMSTSSASPRSPWPKKLSPAKWKTLSRQGGCFVHFKASKHDLDSIQTIVGYQGRTRLHSVFLIRTIFIRNKAKIFQRKSTRLPFYVKGWEVPAFQF